jgi:hypothetical protein
VEEVFRVVVEKYIWNGEARAGSVARPAARPNWVRQHEACEECLGRGLAAEAQMIDGCGVPSVAPVSGAPRQLDCRPGCDGERGRV